jgi:hypothetical protein
MTTAQKRRGGGIFEEATLEKKVEEAEGQVTPSQPGLDAIGATPKQSEQALKAKQPIIQEAVAKEETLAGAQRLRDPAAEQAEVSQLRMQMLENLKTMGSMGARVQNKIASKWLSQVQQTSVAATINQEMLEGLVSPDQEAEATRNMKIFVDHIAEAQKYDTAEGKKKWLDRAQKALADLENMGVSREQVMATAGMEDSQIQKTIGDLDLDASQLTMGVLAEGEEGLPSSEDMAAALGVNPGDVENMTLEEFTQAIEDTRQAEFSRMSSMRANLASIPVGSAHYAEAVAEMRALGMVGEAGIEADMSELQNMIEESQTVYVGDQALTVEDMLSDENLSQVIGEYLNPETSEERKQELREAYGEDFVGWVEGQSEALGQLVAEAELQVAEFGDVQTQWKNLGTVAGGQQFDTDQLAALGISYDPDTAVTAQITANTKKQLEKTGSYQVMNMSMSDFSEDMQTKMASLNIKESDWAGTLSNLMTKMTPANLKTIKDWTPDQIMESYLAAREVSDGSPESLAIKKLVGVDIPDFPDTGVSQSIKEMSAAVNSLPDGYRDMMNDPTWQDFVRKHPEHIPKLSQNPERFDRLREWKSKNEQLETMSPETVLSELLGESFDSLQTKIDDLKRQSKYDEGADRTLKALLNNWDLDGDGDVDREDAEAVKSKMIEGRSHITAAGILKGSEDVSRFDKKAYKLPTSATDLNQDFETAMSDGKLTANELNLVSTPEEKRAMIDLFADVDPEAAASLSAHLAEDTIEDMLATSEKSPALISQESKVEGQPVSTLQGNVDTIVDLFQRLSQAKNDAETAGRTEEVTVYTKQLEELATIGKEAQAALDTAKKAQEAQDKEDADRADSDQASKDFEKEKGTINTDLRAPDGKNIDDIIDITKVERNLNTTSPKDILEYMTTIDKVNTKLEELYKDAHPTAKAAYAQLSQDIQEAKAKYQGQIDRHDQSAATLIHNAESSVEGLNDAIAAAGASYTPSSTAQFGYADTLKDLNLRTFKANKGKIQGVINNLQAAIDAGPDPYVVDKLKKKIADLNTHVTEFDMRIAAETAGESFDFLKSKQEETAEEKEDREEGGQPGADEMAMGQFESGSMDIGDYGGSLV